MNRAELVKAMLVAADVAEVEIGLDAELMDRIDLGRLALSRFRADREWSTLSLPKQPRVDRPAGGVASGASCPAPVSRPPASHSDARAEAEQQASDQTPRRRARHGDRSPSRDPQPAMMPATNSVDRRTALPDPGGSPPLVLRRHAAAPASVSRTCVKPLAQTVQPGGSSTSCEARPCSPCPFAFRHSTWRKPLCPDTEAPAGRPLESRAHHSFRSGECQEWATAAKSLICSSLSTNGRINRPSRLRAGCAPPRGPGLRACAASACRRPTPPRESFSARPRSTETSWLTPRSAMVTPNRRSMRAMVIGIVGDDDEARLGAPRHVVEEVAEALDIGVVERRVHLVEHADRRGIGEEHGEDQRHRRQRLLAAGEQRHRLRLLARRPGEDLQAGLERIVRFDQLRARPCRRRRGVVNSARNGRCTVLEGGEQPLASLAVEVADGRGAGA